jgi:hypothetical protein
MQKYTLARNAVVDVTSSRDSKNHPVANITVNTEFNHVFPSTSRVSRALETMTADDLRDRLMGGTFFFVDKQLVDYRDGFYNGFVQDDASIASLVRVIGIQESRFISTHLQDNLVTKRYVLGAKWGASHIVVPQYKGAGDFENELLFGWSPFNKDVNSAFMLKQTQTGNVLRGMASFLKKRIPLMNRWEEHLDIACKQLQVRIESEVKRRFAIMGTERASIQELQLVYDHAKTRIDKGQNLKGSVAEVRLQKIMHAMNPVLHSNKVYKEQVFTDKRLAAQRKGHLSVFDTYTLATEARTHAKEVDGSSNLALDRFSNDLIFNHTDLTQYGARYEGMKYTAFDGVEQAFYGNPN